MAHIKKIKRKKGTVYRAEIRRIGHQYISKTFKRLLEARDWAKRTERELKLLDDATEQSMSSDLRIAALENEIKRLRKEIQKIKKDSQLHSG